MTKEELDKKLADFEKRMEQKRAEEEEKERLAAEKLKQDYLRRTGRKI